MSKKTQQVRKPWKPHKQKLVNVGCGVRVEVDKNIAALIMFLNYNGIETRHSCEGKKNRQGYVSMFATPRALGLAQYLLVNGAKTQVQLERDIHPNGYENLVVRWPKKNQKKFEELVRTYLR